MLDPLSPLEVAGRLGLALAMAVFMGLAFEGVYKREEHSSPGGIRTFPMLAALGALLFLLQPKWLLPFLVGLGAVAAWMSAHIRHAHEGGGERPTLVIPTANLLAYTLGPVALTQPPWLIVAITVTVVLLLEGREALHRLAQRVAPDEVLTLGKFLILVGVILPLVPNHPIVDWTPISPFQIWLALVAISTLSYASYLVQRYLPQRSGVLLPAVLGGFYSSTATTVALARRQKESGSSGSDLTAGIVLATSVMYARIDIMVAIFNAPLALELLPPLAVLLVLGLGTAAWQWRHRDRSQPEPQAILTAVNPLQLGTAVTFAVLFVVIALASSWTRSHFGERGVFGLAAITGVTDINPFVLSLAQGGVATMSLRALSVAILIAVASNNALNGIYALMFGDRRVCRRGALVLFGLAAVGLVLALLTLKLRT